MSGIAISLQIVFAVIAGGMFVQLGPAVGVVFTLLLAEALQVMVGHDVHSLDSTQGKRMRSAASSRHSARRWPSPVQGDNGALINP